MLGNIKLGINHIKNGVLDAYVLIFAILPTGIKFFELDKHGKDFSIKGKMYEISNKGVFVAC